MIDISENLLASIDPIRKINEDMQRVLNPMHDIHESMRLATSNIGNTHSLYSNSAQELAKQIETITNPLDSLQKQMEAMCDPMKEIQEQMKSLYSVTSPLMEQVNTLKRATQSIQDSMTSIGLKSLIAQKNLFTSNATIHRKLIDDLSASIIGNIATMNVNEIVTGIRKREGIYKDIIASVPMEKVNNDTFVNQLNIAESEIISSLQESNVEIEAQLEAIQAQIIAQKNPFLLIVFMNAILPLLISIIFEFEIKPVIEPFYKNTASQLSLKKEVKRSVYQYIQDPKMRKKVRFVKANVLNIRQGMSKKTKKIGMLYFGELVEIKQKEKNWCYIRRYDERSKTYIEGWVYTRYLARIR